MAKYQVECSVCGKSFTRVLFGPGKDREWKLNQPQDCPECWKAGQDAIRAKAYAVAVEFGKSLPALGGSEKQIAWAESLRKTAIEKVEKAFSEAQKENPEIEAGIYYEMILKKFKQIPNAKFWIETRNEYPVNLALGDFKDWLFAR